MLSDFKSYKGFNFFQSLLKFELNSFDSIEKMKETGYQNIVSYQMRHSYTDTHTHTHTHTHTNILPLSLSFLSF